MGDLEATGVLQPYPKFYVPLDNGERYDLNLQDHINMSGTKDPVGCLNEVMCLVKVMHYGTIATRRF